MFFITARTTLKLSYLNIIPTILILFVNANLFNFNNWTFI
nr:MAG TPA: hypothetical protein [Caudoviricetes sp.]